MQQSRHRQPSVLVLSPLSLHLAAPSHRILAKLPPESSQERGLQWTIRRHNLLPRNMMPSKISIVLMVAHLPEQAISIEGRTTCQQLTVSGSQSKQNRIHQVHIVCSKIDFIPPDPMQSVAPDRISIIWESLNHAAVWKLEFCFLRLQIQIPRVASSETC